jgi:hypothetical protein
MFSAVGLTIVVLGIAVALGGFVYEKRHRRSVYSKRDSLSHEEIYRTYYSASEIPPEKVAELWEEVALTLGVPAQKLRPTDIFGNELGGGYLITSEKLDALTTIADKRAKSLGLTLGFEEIRTLDDYVRFFGSKSKVPPTNESKGPTTD